MEAPHLILFSTPLISTWVFDETHRILFDAGDGVTALLDSKIHKIRLAAITHTHRDHCAGLMQLLNLRGGVGDFTAVYPEASGSGRALAGFLTSFDARSTGKVIWKPIGPGDSLDIEPERHFLRAFPTDHYVQSAPPRALSLGYQIVRMVDKVKSEFRDLAQPELDALRLKRGREHLTETLEDILFTITGDTMPMDPDKYKGSRVLLHECTFLDIDERKEMANRGHPHTCLEEALDIAKAARVGRLGLYHISRRYEDEHILSKVRERCAKIGLDCPVSVALPGRIYDDFFSHCAWQGTTCSG
jgi:ribonuclease Z